MLKKIVAPLQSWLLNNGKCVGCGMPLSRAEREDRGDGTEKVICKCGRIFIYDQHTKTYRRALFSEV